VPKISRATLTLATTFISASLVLPNNLLADNVSDVVSLTLDQYEQQSVKSTTAPVLLSQLLAQNLAAPICLRPDDTATLVTLNNTEAIFDEETTSLLPRENNQLALTDHSDTIQKAEDLPDDSYIDLLDLKDMDIADVLKLISEKSRVNIIAGQGVIGKVSIYLRNVKLKEALKIILDSNNLAYSVQDGIVRVMPAPEFEQRFGYKFGGDIQTKVLRLQYASIPDMAELLKQIKSPYGKIISDTKSSTLVLMDAPTNLDLMEKLLKDIDVPVETAVYELSYSKAEDIATKVGETLTQNVGKIKFDKRSNTIVVTDTPNTITEIERVVRSFDVKEKQVLIEAKIMQVILNDQNKYGVNWEAVIANYHGLNFTSAFDILNSADKRGQVSIGTVDNDNYTAMVQALETAGKTNILSNPSITAINNQEAKILVGSTQPYVTTTTTTPSSGPTTVSETVNFIDVGVKLYVTPTIHKDDFITMKIRPEVSSVTSNLKTGNNNTIPVVETSQAETTVSVKHGVTIVIGGLIKEEKLSTINRVPILGSLPLLGFIFRNKDTSVRKTEIVIFLTPKIISGDVPEPASREPLSVDNKT